MTDGGSRTATFLGRHLGLWMLSAAVLASACGRTPLLPPSCVLHLEPAALDFGQVSTSAPATRSLALANQGSAACTIANVGLGPDSDLAFALGPGVPTSLVLRPEEAATLTVTFSPSSVWPPLERKGTLILQSNDPARPDVTVPLTGQILSNCQLAIAPPAIDFGHVALDATIAAAVTVTNVGADPCQIAGIGFAPGGDSQFRLDAGAVDDFTLPPTDHRDIAILFHATDPARPHHRTAQLVFATTDRQKQDVAVLLSADIDVGCELSMTPASLDFGNVILNTTASAHLTLGNDGSQACPVSGLALAADSDPGFSLDPTQALAFTVEPGASQSIPITFGAFASEPPHLKTGTLVMQTGNPRAPQASVPLSAFVNTVCVEASRWIYTVDQVGMLSSFDPATLSFIDIATLNCPGLFGPGSRSTSSPNSMAVDQNAVAWVNYLDGTLFKVDTSNGHCDATSFQTGQHGIQIFGMGFVFDPSTGLDTLYIAGGPSFFNTSSTLATVAFPSLVVTPIGTVKAGMPELSGTGDGTLWGFFPASASASSQATLVRLDPQSGATLESYTYPKLTGGASWAMKFWGGAFWIFVDDSVYRVSRDAPTDIQTVMPNTGRQIVGAGVSTCAPLRQ